MRAFAVILLLALVVSCGPSGDAGASGAGGAGSGEASKEAIAHFERFLSDCSESQIRCLWFHGEKVGSASEMVLDTLTHTKMTLEDEYLVPLKGSAAEDIGPEKAAEAKSLVGELPASDAGVDFAHGHHVTYWSGGQRVARVYTRKNVPAALGKLYEIGGGKLPGAK